MFPTRGNNKEKSDNILGREPEELRQDADKAKTWMCRKCIHSKGQTIRRMPESNLSRAHKQCCHLLCVYGERGRHSQRTLSQRTLRRGALAMLVRNNGLGLKKTSLYASRAAALLPGNQNIYHTLMRVSSFSANIAVKTLQLTHLDT